MTGSHPWFPSGFTVERIDSPTIFGFLPIWGRANPKLQRDNPVRKVFLKLGRYTSQAMTRLSTCRNSMSQWQPWKVFNTQESYGENMYWTLYTNIV